VRLAVLFCGILSGVVALGFGWWGAQGLLFNTSQLPQLGYVLVVLAIHVIALTSIAGGMAVLVAPPVGRIAMLSSAVGWLALIAVLGGGIGLPVAGLIVLSAAGGLGAFLPSVQTPAFRIERPGQAGATVRPRATEAMAYAPSAAEIEIERVRAKAAADEAAERGDHSRFVALNPIEEYSRPFPVVAPVEDHSKPFVPSEPDFALGPIPRSEERRQTLRAPYDFRRGGPAKPKRKPSRRRASVVSGAIVVLILVLIGAPLLYLGATQLQPTQVLPATAVEPSVSRPASEEEPRLAPQAELAPVLAQPASAAAAPASSAVADEFASLPPLSALPSAASSAEPVVAAAKLPPLPSDKSFGSPFDYCTAFTNADAPEAKKITAGLTELIFNARKRASLSQGDVHWRCMDKAVWVCVVPPGGLACDKVPDSVDRVLICASHPDAKGIRTAAGDWSCDGFTPVVSQAQLNAPDRRGFDKNVWQKVDGPEGQSG
jgi:hypothetical protein